MARKSSFRYTSYRVQFRQKIEAVTTDLLIRMSVRGRDLAKQNMVANGTIDTGFALSKIVARTPNADGIPGSVARLPNRQGRHVVRESYSSDNIDSKTGGFESLAVYTFWLEIRYPFMSPAVEQIRREFKTLIAQARAAGLS